MKFILPQDVVKVTKAEAATVTSPKLWPIGTLYKHTPTNTYFRFLKMGGRWDCHFGICTHDGVLTAKGLQFPERTFRVTKKTKIEILNQLITFLNDSTINGKLVDIQPV